MADITGTPADETLDGTAFNDRIVAGDGDDTVMGLGGDDLLSGQDGDDLLNGGSGDDTLRGGAGADTMIGGSGSDLIYAGDPLLDVIDGGSGHDTLSFAFVTEGVRLDQFADISHIERIVGSDFSDTLSGGLGVSRIDGGDGDDFVGGDNMLIKGGQGSDQLGGREDTLVGGSGDDFLISNGNSVLDGGAGKDIYQGSSSGGDTFVYDDNSGHRGDQITNLRNTDVIDLHAIDADVTTGGDQAFTLVQALDGHAGQAALVRGASATTLLELDTDGDGSADVVIHIQGSHTDFTNFVL